MSNFILFFLINLFFLFTIHSFAAQPEGKWIRTDMHSHPNSHNYGSDDHGNSAAMADLYKAMGFNYQLITDHNHFKEFLYGHAQAYNAASDPTKFKIGAGQETWPGNYHWTIANVDYTKPLFSDWPNSDNKSNYAYTKYIGWFDSVGAWISLNHPAPPDKEPYSSKYPNTSGSYQFRGTYDSLKALVQAGLKGFEAFNGANSKTWLQSQFIWESGGWWDSLLIDGLRFRALSGSDKHGAGTLYHGYGVNNVYILQDTITEASYWEAMYAGRSYICADFHSGSPFAINMNVTVGDSMLGSRVELQNNIAEVRVQVNLDTVYLPIWSDNIPQLDTIKVISNGAILATIHPKSKRFDSTFQITIKDSNYVRVVAVAKNLSHSSNIRALANPIYLIEGNGVVQLETKAEYNTGTFRTYPNPFNPSIQISFPKSIDQGKLSIFNAKGERVFYKKIKNTFKWNAGNMPAGLYTVLAESPHRVFTKKIILSKKPDA